MKTYTLENQPKSGNGRKIWKAIQEMGYKPLELWYNANCWGAGYTINGNWGTWMVRIEEEEESFYHENAYPCIIDKDGKVRIFT